jgi:hypothetical protein
MGLRHSHDVATLGLTFSDPPTQMEMQALANTLDELIAALRRRAGCKIQS